MLSQAIKSKRTKAAPVSGRLSTALRGPQPRLPRTCPPAETGTPHNTAPLNRHSAGTYTSSCYRTRDASGGELMLLDVQNRSIGEVHGLLNSLAQEGWHLSGAQPAPGNPDSGPAVLALRREGGMK